MFANRKKMQYESYCMINSVPEPEYSMFQNVKLLPKKKIEKNCLFFTKLSEVETIIEQKRKKCDNLGSRTVVYCL